MVKMRPCAAILLAGAAQLTTAIQLDVHSVDSIKNATSIVAYGLMKYYTGNVTNTPSTIAVLPGPYYWWEAGAMWGAMVDYFHYTNDSTYNDVTYQALVSQVGPDYDYMVPIHQTDEGNDDQAFWGFATMSAAEHGFPEPPSPIPSWLQLTINLWNTQVVRWDNTSCGGGLKWQIFKFNNGYDYKNSVSNGAFFLLSARLARMTGNQTYVDWAIKSYDWSRQIGLIDQFYYVYDGTDDLMNCNTINRVQWSYSAGMYLYGSAVLYNYTNGSSLWSDRTTGFLDGAAVFFSPFENSTNIMWEEACEGVGTCITDQWSFKAYLGRFMWATTQVAPFTAGAISTLLTTTSKAAAGSCTGGTEGVTCGVKWYVGGFDGIVGVGQQLSALEVMQGLLVNVTSPPIVGDNVHLSTPTTTASIASVPAQSAEPSQKAATATSDGNQVGSASASVTSIESAASATQSAKNAAAREKLPQEMLALVVLATLATSFLGWFT